MKPRKTAKMSESKLQLGDRHINYAEGPNNGPPMLLNTRYKRPLAGLGLGFAIFPPPIGRSTRVDLRGHGKSSWVNNDYHWRNYALDQVEFIERVVGEPVFVVGHSLGGATAVGLNALRSDLVRAAVYEDPPLFVHQRWEGNQFRISFTATLEVLDTKPDFDTVLAHVRETNPDLDDDYCRKRAEKLIAMDPDVFRSTLSGRARANWRSEDLAPTR